MLNEAYEQELVARGVDTMAIKAEIEKRFEEEKQIMPKKEEVIIYLFPISNEEKISHIKVC